MWWTSSILSVKIRAFEVQKIGNFFFFSFKLKGEHCSHPERAFHWNSGKLSTVSASASLLLCTFCLFKRKEKKKHQQWNKQKSCLSFHLSGYQASWTPPVHTMLSVLEPRSPTKTHLGVRPVRVQTQRLYRKAKLTRHILLYTGFWGDFGQNQG